MADSDAPPIELTARMVASPSSGSIRIDAGAVSLEQRRDTSSADAPAKKKKSSSNAKTADPRQSVAELLLEHAKALHDLRQLVSSDPLYNMQLHDDLWLLRFILSHNKKGGVPAAATAALATMRYRHEYGMDEAGYDATESALRAIFLFYKTVGDAGAITYYCPDDDRGPLIVGVLEKMNFNAIVAAMTPEETALAGRLSSEWLFRRCDEVTRRTGLLTKYARLIDLRELKVSNMNREFQRRDREMSKYLEDFYPQLLDAAYLCHALSWLQVVWRSVRPLLPKRFVEKVDFLSPATNAAERKRLLRVLELDDLPRRFGGGCDAWLLHNSRMPELQAAGLSIDDNGQFFEAKHWQARMDRETLIANRRCSNGESNLRRPGRWRVAVGAGATGTG